MITKVVKTSEAIDDETGELVNILNADKKRHYHCHCSARLIPKLKNGKVTKHYAHKFNRKHNNGIIATEADKHLIMKEAFGAVLLKILENGGKVEKKLHCCRRRKSYESIPVNFRQLSYRDLSKDVKLRNCNEYFDYNILKNITRVDIEKYVSYGNGVIRPDISLYSNDKLIRVIEIINSHKIEETTRNYYKSQRVDVIVINIHSNNESSIFNLLEKLTKDITLIDSMLEHMHFDIYINDSPDILTTIDMLKERLQTLEIREKEIEVKEAYEVKIIGDNNCDYTILDEVLEEPVIQHNVEIKKVMAEKEIRKQRIANINRLTEEKMKRARLKSIHENIEQMKNGE